MPEMFTMLQIQLLLYYLEAEPSKRTVTNAAKKLELAKWVVSRGLDSLEECNLVERIENRKTVLTESGKNIASVYAERYKIIKQYMQYHDIPPAKIRDNVLKALAADFSDDVMELLIEQESRMRLKEVFSGRQKFSGSDLCDILKDGSYFFPFIIYREHVKKYNNISMANKGFAHPCELIIKNNEGMICLEVKTISEESALNGIIMEGKVNKIQYLYNGKFYDGQIDGRYAYFPAKSLNFISVGNGRDTILHGSVCLKLQCDVGYLHMPVSTAIFTVFIH